MARISKQRGYNFENKIVHWFNNEEKDPNKPIGWKAERNRLSKVDIRFGVVFGKHDLKAIKKMPSPQLSIFLQIEAKKTGKDLLTLQYEWIEKIDFLKDELLMISLSRTSPYALIPLPCFEFLTTLSSAAITEKAIETIKCRGEESIRIHTKSIQKATLQTPLLVDWGAQGIYVIFPLKDFVSLREKFPGTLTEKQVNLLLVEEKELQVPISIDTDIPSVEVDIEESTLITCPYTGKPIQLIPRKVKTQNG